MAATRGAAKRRNETHVPEGFQVNDGKPQGNGGVSPQSAGDGASGENADQDATLASLAESVSGIQLQLVVMVEWLGTIDQRLDAIEERLEQGF